MSGELQRTGAALRRGQSKQDYGTPWEFIVAVSNRFGPLRADLACTRENAKAPDGIYFDDGLDSLAVNWADRFSEGGNLWLNPPYANIAPWAAKCAATSPSYDGFILLLTPASIGTDWFAEHVHRRAMVLALSPRITFEAAEDPYPKDLMLSVYGYGIHGFDTWRWK